MAKLFTSLFKLSTKKHDKEQSVDLPSALVFGQSAKSVAMETDFEEVFVNWETPIVNSYTSTVQPLIAESHVQKKDDEQVASPTSANSQKKFQSKVSHMTYNLVRQANDANVIFHPAYTNSHFSIVQFVQTSSSSSNNNRFTGQLIYDEKRNDELTLPNIPAIACVQSNNGSEIYFAVMIPKSIVVWTLNTISLRVTQATISHSHADLREVYTVLANNRIIFTTSHCLIEFDCKTHTITEHHFHVLFKKLFSKQQTAAPIALLPLSSRYLFFWVKLTEFGSETVTTLINTTDQFWQALPYRCSIMGDRDWSEESYQSLRLSDDMYLLSNDMDTLLFSSTHRIISFLQKSMVHHSEYHCSIVESSSFDNYTLLFAPHYGDLMRVKISSPNHNTLTHVMTKLLEQTISYSNGDITILTSTKILSCHAIIVQIRAPKLFDAIDKNAKLLSLNSYSAASVNCVLQYIYTASIPSLNLATDIAIVKELKEFATHYELKAIAKLCDKYLRKQQFSFDHVSSSSSSLSSSPSILAHYDDSIKFQMNLSNQAHAKQLAEQMIKDHPEDAKGYAYSASVSLQSGNPWLSLKQYAKALQLDPLNLGYENAIACIFQQLMIGKGAVLSSDQQEIIDSIQYSSLAKSFVELIQFGNYDFKFILLDKTYGAHQVFLKIGSDFFNTIVNHNLASSKHSSPANATSMMAGLANTLNISLASVEINNNKITFNARNSLSSYIQNSNNRNSNSHGITEIRVHEELPDMNDTVMDTLLQFIYTRETTKLIEKLSTQNVMILCKAASFFGYTDLEQECGHVLCSSVTIQNVSSMLDFAHLMQQQELLLTCANVQHETMPLHPLLTNFDMKKVKFSNDKIVDLLVLAGHATWLQDRTIQLVSERFNQTGRVWLCQLFNFEPQQHYLFHVNMEFHVSKVNPKYPLMSHHNTAFLNMAIQNTTNQQENAVLYEYNIVDQTLTGNSGRNNHFQPLVGSTLVNQAGDQSSNNVNLHLLDKFTVHIIGKYDEKEKEYVMGMCINPLNENSNNGEEASQCNRIIVMKLGKNRVAKLQQAAKKQPFYFAIEAVTRRTYCNVVMKGLEARAYAQQEFVQATSEQSDGATSVNAAMQALNTKLQAWMGHGGQVYKAEDDE